MMILPVFFALVKPASTIAKPACIQNTSAAPIKNHTEKTSVVVVSEIRLTIDSLIKSSSFYFIFFIQQAFYLKSSGSAARNQDFAGGQKRRRSDEKHPDALAPPYVDKKKCIKTKEASLG